MLSGLPPTIRLTGIGFFFALCIILGIAAGVGLDSWLGTRPLFVLLGLFLGLAGAFWGGYLLLMEVLGQRTRGKGGDDA